MVRSGCPTCKKIKRDELWMAVRCINQDVNHRLLQLIEFHTASTAKTPQPIRYDGRFLEQRAPQGVIERLPRCFAKYDRLDAVQTVRHILDLTAWLSETICEKYDYPFIRLSLMQYEGCTVRCLTMDRVTEHAVLQSGQHTISESRRQSEKG